MNVLLRIKRTKKERNIAKVTSAKLVGEVGQGKIFMLSTQQQSVWVTMMYLSASKYAQLTVLIKTLNISKITIVYIKSI